MCINDYSRRVSAYSWVEDEGNIWLPMADKNGICKIDCSSGNTELVMQFPNYDITKKDLYFYSLYMDNKIIFVPYRAEEVAVYDIKKELLEVVPLKHADSLFEGVYSEENKFVDGLMYGSSAYMFGYSYPAIVKLDINTMKLTYLTDWMAYYPCSKVHFGFLAEGHAQIGSDVYLAMKNTNMLIRLNLESGVTEVFPIECAEKKIMSVATYSGNVLLISWEDCGIGVASWNPSTKIIREYRIETNKYVETTEVYWIPVVTGNCVYLFPLHGDKVYVINLSTGEYFRHREIEKIIADARNVSLLNYYTILSARNVSGRIVFQTGKDYCFHEFDPTTGKISSYCYLITDSSYMKKYWQAERKDYLREADMPLPYLLSGLRWKT